MLTLDKSDVLIAASLRAKRLPQDRNYTPEKGIKMLNENVVFHPVPSADFRIDSLNIPKVVHDLQSYFSRMPTQIRVDVASSWDRLRNRLESLPRRLPFLPPMRIESLLKMSPTDVILAIPDEYAFVNDDLDALPDISGDHHEEGPSVSVGQDIVVYTEVVLGRPWVGRVKEVYPESKEFLLQWFERSGKSTHFRAMTFGTDKKPFVTKLEDSCIMYNEISVHKGDLDFHISHYWISKIMKSYKEQDEGLE